MKACNFSKCVLSVPVSRRASVLAPLPSRSVSCEAKKGKKKGGKKGGNKKGGGLLSDMPKLQPWQTTDVIMQHLLLIESYRRAAGKPLVENAEIEKIADVIFEAPFAVIVHNRFAPNVPDDEAIYTYANQAALDAFQADSFHDLVGVPSSICVKGIEDSEEAGREACLKSLVPDNSSTEATEAPVEEEADDEEVEGDRPRMSDTPAKLAVTQGRRIGLKGRIIETEYYVWNVVSPTVQQRGRLPGADLSGTIVGQAACFGSYKLEDGTVVKCGVDPATEIAEASPEALAAAEAAVEEQAAAVRDLKAQEGVTNKSPEVQEAVEELLRRKEHVQALQAVLQPAAEEAAA